MFNNLSDQLERIKQLPMYGVVLWYGEGVGCDDIGESQSQRQIQIYAHPVGVLGEARQLWVCSSLESFLKMDVAAKPKIVSNPPTLKETEEDGIYLYGTESAIKSLVMRRSSK
jgi:hypothetical protein